ENGVAASFRGGLSVDLDEVVASGTFAFEINTTGAAINETFTFRGQSRTFSMAEGPYVRIVGSSVSIDVLGQSIAGSFIFEQTHTGDIVVAASEVTATFGDGADAVVGFSDGQGAILLTAGGAAAAIRGSVTVNLPSISASGEFQIQVNTTPGIVDTTVDVGGTPVSIRVRDGPSVSIEGRGTNLTIAGQQI